MIYQFELCITWPSKHVIDSSFKHILFFDFLRSDTTPLLNNSSQDRMFDTMSVEIEQLLAKVIVLVFLSQNKSNPKKW